MYQALKASPHFRLLFADRAQKHFFNEGALSFDHVEALMAMPGPGPVLISGTNGDDDITIDVNKSMPRR